MSANLAADVKQQVEDSIAEIHDTIVAAQDLAYVATAEGNDTLRTTVHAPAQAAAGGQAPRIRPILELKPDCIGLTARPAKARDFATQYLSYHQGSNFHLCNNAEAHAYFKACLHPDLRQRLLHHPRYAENRPVLPDDSGESLLEILDNIFAAVWPLHRRRCDFLKSSQQPDQLWSKWKDKVLSLAKEADIMRITPEQVLVTVLLAGTHDEKTNASSCLTSPRWRRFVRLLRPTRLEKSAPLRSPPLGPPVGRARTSAAISHVPLVQGGRQCLSLCPSQANVSCVALTATFGPIARWQAPSHALTAKANTPLPPACRRPEENPAQMSARRPARQPRP